MDRDLSKLLRNLAPVLSAIPDQKKKKSKSQRIR